MRVRKYVKTTKEPWKNRDITVCWFHKLGQELMYRTGIYLLKNKIKKKRVSTLSTEYFYFHFFK